MHSQLQLPLWLTRKLAEKELVKLKGKPQAYSGSMLEDIEADAANAKVKRRGGLYFYDVGLKIRDIREIQTLCCFSHPGHHRRETYCR